MKKQKSLTNNEIFAEITPLNDSQKDLINAIRTSDMAIVSGPAGTGKTFITSSIAALMLKNNIVDKIILSRPVIPTGRSIGFMPGDVMEKMANWVVPFMEVFKTKMSQGEIDCHLKNGNIEIVPFEFMRGRNFDDAFVMLDEAQNVSRHEMKMFLTRIGMYSRTVVMGDPQQSDLHWLEPNEETGLDIAVRLAEKVVNVPVIKFSSDDIVRSDLCKAWIQAFEQEKRNELPRHLTG